MSSPQQMIGQLVRSVFKISRYTMFQVPIPDQQVLNKTQIQINAKLAKYYKDPLLKGFLKSLPPKTLLDESVVMFVGSRTRPQNIQLRDELIRLAIQKAEKEQGKMLQKLSKQQKSHMNFHKASNILSQRKRNQKGRQSQHKETARSQQNQEQITLPNSQKNLAKYYTYAFTKYEAMQKNQPQRWQSCAQTIIELADKGHPLSSMLLAKDYYFRIDSENLSKQKKSQLVIEAAQYFYQSVTQTNLNGLYYLAEMLQEYPELNESTRQEIQQLYIFAAAYGNPLAYAKLAKSKRYKQEGDMKLYMKFLRSAAEAGCIQAQYNLGQQYRLGLNLKKDDVKAFSWFKHAGAHGFVYAKFNEAMMLYQGSECGRIKRNVKAALLQFQDIQRSNTIDVSHQIDQIMKEDQIQRQLQEGLKQQMQQEQSQDRNNQSSNLKLAGNLRKQPQNKKQ